MTRILAAVMIFLASGLGLAAQDSYLIKMIRESSGNPDKLQALTRTLTEAEDTQNADTLKQVRRAWKVLAVELGSVRYYRPAYLALEHYINLKNQAHHNDKDQIVTDESDKLENLLFEVREEEDVLLSKRANVERLLLVRKNEDSNIQMISVWVTLALIVASLIFLVMSLKRALKYKAEAASMRSQLSENLVKSVLGKMSGRIKKSVTKGVNELSTLSEWFVSKEPVLEEQLTGKTIQTLKELVEKSEAVAKQLNGSEITSSRPE